MQIRQIVILLIEDGTMFYGLQAACEYCFGKLRLDRALSSPGVLGTYGTAEIRRCHGGGEEAGFCATELHTLLPKWIEGWITLKFFCQTNQVFPLKQSFKIFPKFRAD